MNKRARVFVYGSLKRNFKHHDKMQGAEFLQECRLSGHVLVLYEGDYPALSQSKEQFDVVTGEVYEVDQAHLERLDAFEDCPDLYQRASVTLDDGTAAYCYRIPVDKAEDCRRVSGTWVERNTTGDDGLHE